MRSKNLALVLLASALMASATLIARAELVEKEGTVETADSRNFWSDIKGGVNAFTHGVGMCPKCPTLEAEVDSADERALPSIGAAGPLSSDPTTVPTRPARD
jgi:hypothetical protein